MRSNRKSENACRTILRGLRSGSGTDPEQMKAILKAERALNALGRLKGADRGDAYRHVRVIVEVLAKCLLDR